MMLKLDKHVPIPKKASGKKRNEEFHNLLEVMEVGDSIAFPIDTTRRGPRNHRDILVSRQAENFRAMARTQFGYKMTMRSSSDGSEMRIWRVS
jgi:hypothetical protein